MSSFAKLKKNSGAKALGDLIEKVNKFDNPETIKRGDDRFWSAHVDKAGNGYAVIRLLPPPDGEDTPFVRVWDHGFQGPSGLWYIENSLTTIGKNDPVSEYNSKLWNSGLESDKEIARKQKRRLHYISNIYVITDSGNPENEGKVFLFKYGKKIYNKFKEAMYPEFEDETPLNPFDLWEGASFKLKIRKVDGYRNYDKSEFGDRGPLNSDDNAMEALWRKSHSLQEFIKPENFKSYEDLSTKLAKVLADTPANTIAKAEDEDAPWVKEAPAPKQKAAKAPVLEAEDDEDDEGLAFFKKLANG